MPIRARSGWRACSAAPRRFAALAAALALAGCGSHETGPESATQRLFARGVEQITDLYIEPVSSQTLVFVGAKNLAKLDPRLTANYGGGEVGRDHVTLNFDGIAVTNYYVPRDVDPQQAGEIVAGLIAAAKRASPHVAALPEETIERAVFEAMTGILDRFSHYAPPEEARDQRAARDGFGGIGVTLDTANNDFAISEISERGPAQRAGIRIGDKIVAIDGTPVAGHRPSEVIHLLRGPIGSAVRLTIARAGVPGTRDIRLERELVIVPTVTETRDGNILVFRIASFNQSTTQRVAEGIAEAQRAGGGQLAGIVLDLRGDPGGLLDQAVTLSDLFIAKGPIIATIGRHPASHQYFAATGHSVAPTTPLVVLINGGSASASEIVAAALQDAGRAVVIGSASYGKGTVQTVMRLPNDGELTITWARLVTPSGYFLQQHGVVPTLCTDGLGSGDGALNAALQRMATPAAEASRPRASLDEAGWTALRQACPAEQGSPPVDLKLAERVLSDPARYSAALGAIHPAAALAPEQPAALTAAGPGLSSKPRLP